MRPLRRRVLHGMTQSDERDSRQRFVHAPAQHRHRIRVVQHPRVRTMRHDVAADLQQLRQGAQATHDAARRQRIADRLIDAVTLRNVDLALDRFITADEHADDHVVGAGQRVCAIVVQRIASRPGSRRPCRSVRRCVRRTRAARESTSTSAKCASRRCGYVRMSAVSRLENTRLPAPMIAMRATLPPCSSMHSVECGRPSKNRNLPSAAVDAVQEIDFRIRSQPDRETDRG